MTPIKPPELSNPEPAPLELPFRSVRELIVDSDALMQAVKAGSLARMWAKYTVGPRAGEQVLVLATTTTKRLPNGALSIMSTPVAEILQHAPFECLEYDGEVTPPADAPRIIIPDHLRR